MTLGSHRALAQNARLTHLESLIHGVRGLAQGCLDGARLLATQAADPALHARRRDLAFDLPKAARPWAQLLGAALTQTLSDLRLGRPIRAKAVGGQPPADITIDIPLSLVDDSALEQDLTASRLAQAVADLTGNEYTDLNARLQAIGGAVDPGLSQNDVLSPTWVARQVLDAWVAAELPMGHWQTLQNVLHQEVSQWVQEGYHLANQLLLEQGVRPEIDLRPFIRRARDTVPGLTRPGELDELPTPGVRVTGAPSGSNSGLQPLGRVHDETRLLTQTPAMMRGGQPQALLSQLTALVARQVPGFMSSGGSPGRASWRGTGGATLATGPAAAVTEAAGAEGGQPEGAVLPVSPGLGRAIREVGDAVRRRADPRPGEALTTPEVALRGLEQDRAVLKQAAASPAERATIEVVALLFQSILMEERLPAAVRVWFARLQMPVLRVAVSEPDFFASTHHPARRLIDRMGSCVMGFVSGSHDSDDALHKEIKRIVQVVEAYPDTGRKVFQTVLTEFERFLETYFRDEHAASRKGVSLAQQVEQRETWAIQYTIELRKMLESVPVHEGVREFLFRVWADVLAHSAVQTGQASEETRALKRAAADLIWSASAKTSREERAEVLRRLPPLLKLAREGMMRAGLATEAQDAHIQSLNTALAAAFSARSAPLSSAHLREVTQRLESLDELLPDLDRIQLDAATLRDLSGHESEDLEVVAEGGTLPTPAMQAWARELQIGAWFQLDYRGRSEHVQLAWQGLHKQLSLFVTPQGRGVLFQLHRLGAFLQAGLMLPLEEESLTTRATRQALAKLDADPARLLG
jgi:hypothetical protein